MAYKQRISGSIDSYGWFRWQIQHVLSQHKDEEVHLIIMSPGGVVNEAIAISDLLAEHGNVTVEFSGLAASAATWLAFGAKRVIMHEDTLWLCHKSSTVVDQWSQMNADELDAYIEKLKSQQKSLEVIDAIIAKKYLDRCSSKGKTLQQVVELMKEERYLPAADCLAWGFVDEVLPTKSADEGVKVNNEFLNAIHLPSMEDSSGIGVHTEPEESASLANTIIQKIMEFFKGKEKETSESTQNNTEQKPNIIYIMRKDFVLVNALLGVEGIEVAEDNKATLTVEQLTAIENRLKAAADAEKTLDEVSPKVKNMSGIANKVTAVTIMLDNAPVAPAQVEKRAEGASNEVTVEGGDDITAEARKMANRSKKV